MKVIFLDIDGVLNLISQGHDKYGGIFHTHFIENLKHIIEETNAKIVVSSTWRASGLQYLRDMWKDRNYPGEIIAITPKLRDCRIRGKEISVFMELFHIDNYVILDDDTDMLDEQLNNFVKCSNNFDHTDHVEGYGLTKECTEQAIKILNDI